MRETGAYSVGYDLFTLGSHVEAACNDDQRPKNFRPVGFCRALDAMLPGSHMVSDLATGPERTKLLRLKNGDGQQHNVTSRRLHAHR